MAYSAVIFWVLLTEALSADLRIEPGAFGSGKAYVRCSFDGVEQMCFLDTGSAMSLVGPSKPFLRKPSSGKFRYKSASGKLHEAEVMRVGTIILDGKVIHDVRIGRLARPDSENTLGMDLLGRFPFSLDFRTEPKLRLEPKRRVDRELRDLRVLKSGLMAMPILLGGVGTFAVWDTGASVTAVDINFVRAYPKNFQKLTQKIEGVDGTGETLKLELYRARELQIGTKRFTNPTVVVLDLSPLRDSVGTAVQAVIGSNLIRRAEWYFDRNGRKWSVR